MNRRSFLATLLAPLAAPFVAPLIGPLVVTRPPFKTALGSWTDGSSSPIEDIERAKKLLASQPAYRPDVIPYVDTDGAIKFRHGIGILTPRQWKWRAAKP